MFDARSGSGRKDRKIKNTYVQAFFVVLASFACLQPWVGPASGRTIINQSGKDLSSLFEGLRSSPVTGLIRASHYHPENATWGGIKPHLPGIRPAEIIGGGSCPGGEVCSNHFVLLSGAGSCRWNLVAV